MGVLRRFFGGLTVEEFDGMVLGSDAGWEVAPTRDSVKFFQHVPLILPSRSVLYFEATALAPDIRDFLDDHAGLATCKVHAGDRWPWPERFHVAFSPEVARELAGIVRDFADAEICDHFLAYQDGRILLEWFDAWKNPLYLSRRVSEAQVAEFCRMIGSSFRKYEAVPKPEERLVRK
ncbi:MAG TPA: hypothetical protein VI454_10390 [Verrucomicrobiae bacterium]|jgi:hypothetical protein